MGRSPIRTAGILVGLAACLGGPTPSRAGFDVNVTFDDPSHAYAAYYDSIRTDIVAAGAEWGRNMSGQTTIDVGVRFAYIGSADGTSALASYYGQDGGLDVFEQGVAAKVRTGVDVTGSAPDAFITLDPNYLAHELFYTPAPTPGVVPIVPPDRTDAYSVFLHEFGHILAFDGFRDPSTGSLPSTYESTFDKFVTFDGTNFFFTGPRAEAVYGGPVPLQFGNYFHVGNFAPRPGAELDSDLMFGGYFYRGRRYSISSLDLAIASDVGLPVLIEPDHQVTPEPSSLVLLGLGAGGLLAYRRARRPRPS